MYFPENIDVLILTFLGIENRHRCLAKTKRNIICKNNISPYNFFLCHTHRKQLEKNIISKNLISIFEIYKMIYEKRRMNKKSKFDSHGFYKSAGFAPQKN